MEQIEINLSSSALSHASCMLELYRVIVEGYKEPRPAAAVVYGTAVHKYRDVMFKTGGHIPTARDAALEAFNIPKEDNRKSLHLSDSKHMLCTAFNYWEMYVSKDTQFEYLELNGKPATEVTFSIPYMQTDKFRVNLCGTLDGIGKMKGGCYCIADLKTTSAWDTYGYFTKYKQSKQLRFYRLALKLMSQMYPESILGQIGATKVGAFIDALFVKPAASDNKYARSEVFQYPEEHMIEYENDLRLFINRMLNAFEFPDALTQDGIITGACEKGYGKLCMFFNVCGCHDKNVAKILLDRDFLKKPFNPLNYSE